MSRNDWFETLFGVRESSWAATQARFTVEGDTLRSNANGRRFPIGRFSAPPLAELRSADVPKGRLRVSHVVIGDVLALHARPENAGATFQVASQFNCLEFVGPHVVPEDGVTGYALDPTQGPACSLAAAAGTVYRNFLVPIGTQRGQTSSVQLNMLDGLAAALGGPWFEIRNGYTFSTREQLAQLGALLVGLDREALLAEVKVGVHARVGVTFAERWVEPEVAQTVTQVFCSAVSCAYSDVPTDAWAPLATLALDAAYEATLRAAAVDASEGHGSGVVWLTFLGGGAFGNRPEWIGAAIRRALRVCADLDLDVRIAHYRSLDARMVRWITDGA